MTDEENTKGGIVCCVLFLVLIGAFLIYEDLTFRYDVYFDNGYENGFDIFIDGKNKGSVDPVSRVKILMSRGEHIIEIRKKNDEVFESNEVTLSEDKQYENCKYIYNIGRKYFYYVELCEYSIEGGTKRGGWDTEDIGSETFMRYYADFGLDEKCPKEITLRYGTSWTKSKLKRRVNPAAAELSGTADIVENEKESHQVTFVKNSLVSYWNFDKDSGDVASDLSGNGGDGTIHGAKLVDGKYGMALEFDGVDDYVGNTNLLSDVNTFTMEIWISPRTTHEIDDESTSGLTGVSGQKYVIYPTHGKAKWGAGHAGAGISVGTNGVSVYEHAHNYMPPLLVWQGSLSEGTHIVVVYNNKQPSLYVNGEFRKTGLTSTKTYIHPSIGTPVDGFGGGSWGHFNGIIDEVRIYNYALTEEEIKTAMHSSAASS